MNTFYSGKLTKLLSKQEKQITKPLLNINHHSNQSFKYEDRLTNATYMIISQTKINNQKA